MSIKKINILNGLSSNGSSGNGETLEQVYPAPKAIAFLVHGMRGKATSWNNFKASTPGISYASRIIYLDLVLTKDTTISTLGERLRSLRDEINTNTILSVTVQFSNTGDWVSNQVHELNTIIEMFMFIYTNRTKYVGIGHSKGGLVVTDYVSTYRGLHMVITLGTPFNNEGLMTFIDTFGIIDKSVGNGKDMKRIRDDWNLIPENQVPPTYAIATAVHIKLFKDSKNINNWDDSLIEVDNARGKNYQKMLPEIFHRPNQNNYEHSPMLGRRDIIQFVYRKIVYL